MSITNLIACEEKRNEFQQENADTFKSVLGLDAASALLVKGYREESARSPSTRRSGTGTNKTRSELAFNLKALLMKHLLEETKVQKQAQISSLMT